MEEQSWEEHVRSEVASLLDIYLPNATSGNVGIRYKNPVVSIDEAGEPVEFDQNKAEAVSINIVFEFGEAVDISNTQ